MLQLPARKTAMVAEGSENDKTTHTALMSQQEKDKTAMVDEAHATAGQTPVEQFISQNPVSALKICEASPSEVTKIIDGLGLGPANTQAIKEFVAEHGVALPCSTLSRSFSFGPLPDLPAFTDPTEDTAATPAPNPEHLALQVLDENLYGDIGGRWLDGSMAHYYYGRGTDTTNLLVLSQDGGGSCNMHEHAQFDCQTWLENRYDLLYREKFPPGCSGGDCTGLGSLKETVQGFEDNKMQGPADIHNPDFGTEGAGAHRVRLPYLSGDAYLGQVVTPQAVPSELNGAPHPSPCRPSGVVGAQGEYVVPNLRECGYYASGHLILRNLMHHVLSNQPGSRQITRIFLTGTSAGGRSSLMNCDWLQEFMNTYGPGLGMEDVEVSCAPVAGWMLPGLSADHEDPKAAPTPYPQWILGEVRTLQQESEFGVAEFISQKAYLPVACRAAQIPGEEWRCGMAYVAHPFTAGRVHVSQNKYDFMTKWMEFPAGSWGWSRVHNSGPVPEDERETCQGQSYMKYYGDAMEASLQEVIASRPQDGLFFPSCIDHVQNVEHSGENLDGWGGHAWTRIPVGHEDIDSLQSVTDWFFRREEYPRIIVDGCQGELGGPCNPTCLTNIPGGGRSLPACE